MKKTLSLIMLATLFFVGSVSAVSFSTVHQWMTDNKLTTMSLENFRPNDFITRGEAAKNFNQMAKLLGKDKTRTESECQFNDLNGYDYTLVPNIVEACQYGLVKGHNGKYMPNNKISEAELITVTIRMIMGMQDESKNPRWSAYHEVGVWLGILDSGKSVWDLDSPATRATVGTWLYKASKVDTNAAQKEGTEELEGILKDIFGSDFFTE